MCFTGTIPGQHTLIAAHPDRHEHHASTQVEAKAPQPPRCTTRSTHGEANSASCATRTTRRAGGHTRGRWTAASSCVSAAPIEEKSSSKLSAHTHRAHTTMSGGEQCGRVLRACARLRDRSLPPGRRLEQRRAARHAPQHQSSPLTGSCQRRSVKVLRFCSISSSTR